MDSHQTLHDFVLNLLTDPDARAAFDLDPEGALQAAGLTDITAADVQDVVPLVVDYAPVQGLVPLASTTEQVGVDPLVTDATDVVGQLQAVTQQISVGTSYSGVDVKAGVLGAIAVDPGTVSAGATVLPGIGLGVGPTGLSTDLTGVHDVTHTLDADVVGAVDTVADPVVGDVTGTVGAVDGTLGSDYGQYGDGLLGGNLGVLPGTQAQVDGVVGSLGVGDTLEGLGVDRTVTGAVSSVDVQSTVGGVTQQVDGVLSGVTGTVGGVDAGLGANVRGDEGVTGGASASTDGGLLDITGGLL
ncbi:IniB N-terminal domain-containing protein [Micromonospora sp. H33]|uniref:IniB N-terminal domain-containing protein n=1 Tax=Micromonospora sp. H33 TaxID=3452215 RepID=UPI003F8A674E